MKYKLAAKLAGAFVMYVCVDIIARRFFGETFNVGWYAGVFAGALASAILRR
jgi:hypothetical protein